MPRIIVKTGYMKGKAHKEYYVNYIATRDGVEKYKSDNGSKKATKSQKELIKRLINDYPSSIHMYEYEDFMNNESRENASEFITAVIDQNIYDIATKENYVDYISNRPRVEKLGEHGLFSDAGVEVNLNEIIKEVGEHNGNVWTHIISIKRDDAERLGFDHVENWMNLCQSKRNEIAKAMKISSDHIKWYAAFHNEGHHPHIHMIAFSTDSKEGYVNQKGIEDIRRMFASEIFQNDLLHIYKKQTEKRDEIKSYSREKVIEILNAMNSEHYDNSIIFDKIAELKKSFENYHGRLMYAYIPQKSKQIINDILREMEKDVHLSQLYEEWNLYKKDIRQTYSDKLYEKLPLLEQREFKSIKNMILSEVMNNTFDDISFNEIDIKNNEDLIFNESHETNDNETYTHDYQSQDYIMKWSEVYKKGVAYLYGNDTTAKDIDKAEELLVKEVQKNNVLVYAMLGKIYQLKGDEDKSYEMYKKSNVGFQSILETNGNDDFIDDYCHYRLGKNLFYGLGTEVDYDLAFEHFMYSDTSYAKYNIGIMYQNGLGIQQDDQMAFQYFMQSANKGNVYARYEVGRHYESGIGCQKDSEESQRYYRYSYQQFKAMIKKQEDDNLLYRLGMMTYFKKGCEGSIDESIAYLEKAVELNNKNAKLLLAEIYIREQVFEKIPQTIQWLEEADSSQSRYILGKLYSEGIFVDRDLNKAIDYFVSSGENKYAYNRLSDIYKELGNINESLHYLYKADELEYDIAQFKLGKLFIEGQLVEKDIKKGLYFLKKSESHNNQFAQYMLGKLFLFGKEVEQKKELALDYLTQSALQGNVYAKYLLEHMDDYQNQSLAMMTSRFFHHVSRIIENEMPLRRNNILSGVEHKLKKKLLKKRSALGHKEDDHSLRF